MMKILATFSDSLNKYDQYLQNPDYYEFLEDKVIEITIDNEPVSCIDWIDFENSADDIFEDWYDEDTGELVATSNQLFDMLLDALSDKWPVRDGKYLLSCILTIPYTATISEDSYSNNTYDYDLGYPKISDVYFHLI